MMHRFREPLCEPNCLCIFVLGNTWDPWRRFVDNKSALTPNLPDRSKTVVLLLLFFFVALWFLIRDVSYCLALHFAIVFFQSF